MSQSYLISSDDKKTVAIIGVVNLFIDVTHFCINKSSESFILYGRSDSNRIQAESQCYVNIYIIIEYYIK